jgi:gluconate 2-dehydrogenase gamma chain
MSDLHDRRSFLRAAAAAGAAWATADLAHVEAALAWAGAQRTQRDRAAFSALTAEEASAIEAAASRIIPAVDGRPGAHDAGVVYFIDKALATFNAAQKPLYLDGVRELDRRTSARWSGVARFAALTPSQQDEILRDIERTPFFEAVRLDTIAGMLALPVWGGNRNYAGWHMLGFEHQPQFQPPFGYYDANAHGER